MEAELWVAFSNALSVLLPPPVAPLPGHRMFYLGLLKRYKRLTLLAQATVLLRGSGPGVRLEIAGVDDAPKLGAARLAFRHLDWWRRGSGAALVRAGFCGVLRAAERRPWLPPHDR